MKAYRKGIAKAESAVAPRRMMFVMRTIMYSRISLSNVQRLRSRVSSRSTLAWDIR